jgi:phosphate transport system substrate-binding protein
VDSLAGKPAQFAKPFAENLAHRHYPFDRDVFVVVRERRMGLAAGFSNFVFNEKGQRVLSKAGLLPANDYGREIQIKKIAPIQVEK